MTPRAAARQAPLSMGFSRREYWRELPSLSPGNLPDPGVEPMSPASPALKTDSLLSKPPEKPMNTGVGSLSLLQGIFPTQESNWGLTHCRQILYQGSPRILVGSLSFHQRIFLTQESNRGLLHCRQILYQLSWKPWVYNIDIQIKAAQES